MNFLYKIFARISLAMIIIISIWTSFFYHKIIEEVNDETDDNLELIAENVVRKHLAGIDIPEKISGSNNAYSLCPISKAQADTISHWEFYDEDIFIDEKNEYEPARVLRAVFQDNDDNHFLVTVSNPTVEKADLIESLAIWSALLSIILILSVIILNISIIYPFMKPISRLIKWLKKQSIDTVAELPEHKDIEPEIEKLYTTLEGFIHHNRELFETQKRFIGNASHEIQTPLAIALNRLEMLGQTPLEESQLIEVMKTKRILNHLSKLNKSLLLLSKIDNHHYSTNQIINLNDLVEYLLEDYTEIYAHKEQKVEFINRSALNINMNKELASVLIGNLIKNAFVHTPEEGEISIEASEGKFTITNTASEHGALDTDKIFEPFVQGKSKKGGAGLGLAITKAICDQYNFSLKYLFIDNKHIFEISF